MGVSKTWDHTGRPEASQPGLVTHNRKPLSTVDYHVRDFLVRMATLENPFPPSKIQPLTMHWNMSGVLYILQPDWTSSAVLSYAMSSPSAKPSHQSLDQTPLPTLKEQQQQKSSRSLWWPGSSISREMLYGAPQISVSIKSTMVDDRWPMLKPPPRTYIPPHYNEPNRTSSACFLKLTIQSDTCKIFVLPWNYDKFHYSILANQHKLFDNKPLSLSISSGPLKVKSLGCNPISISWSASQRLLVATCKRAKFKRPPISRILSISRPADPPGAVFLLSAEPVSATLAVADDSTCCSIAANSVL